MACWRTAPGAQAGVYGWYVDLASNSVVVSIGKGGQQAGIDFVAASGAMCRACGSSSRTSSQACAPT